MRPSICSINTFDGPGGASAICRSLHGSYRKRGLDSWMVVGRRLGTDVYTLALQDDKYRNSWARRTMAFANWIKKFNGKVRGAQRASERILPFVASPLRWLDFMRGYEHFNFPGSSHLLELLPQQLNVLHFHNLHGDYFDLRALPFLSHHVPTCITLHDLWLLTGHCAHPFECTLWKSGCAVCEHLEIPPAIRKDAARKNWQRKRQIYGQARLYIVAPSNWTKQRVESSIMMSAGAGLRVIPNGIDTNTFSPGDQAEARAKLGLPQAARIILMAANGFRKNDFKDYRTLRYVVERVAATYDDNDVLCLALGEDAPSEWQGRGMIRFVPYQNDPHIVASYYRAADIYVHAARADTFPLVVAEARACGTPVVASAVGGIVEQITDGITGYLTPAGNGENMAAAVIKLLDNNEQRLSMGQASAKDAVSRFGLDHMVDEYLAFYQEAIDDWREWRRTTP